MYCRHIKQRQGCHKGGGVKSSPPLVELHKKYRSVASGGGFSLPLHLLADQLTLSQPGGHIIPTQYYVPPPHIFRPCDGPAFLVQLEQIVVPSYFVTALPSNNFSDLSYGLIYMYIQINEQMIMSSTIPLQSTYSFSKVFSYLCI